VSEPRFDVTIHAPLALPLYRDGESGASGGAELQTFLLARSLAARGLQVCHVVKHEPDLPAQSFGVHLVTQRIEHDQNLAQYTAEIHRALREADARVYVQRTSGYETGVVAASAKARRRSFVFAASSTWDLTRRTEARLDGRLGHQLGLRLADRVVVQTEDQLAQIEDARLKARARLIRSFATLPSPGEGGEREAFLWIGGLIDYKDPMAYIALAERLPEASFWMVATPREGHEHLAKEVREAAKRLPNLRLIPGGPRAELLPLYERAVAVVNTSTFEGFPNTFLEGWARGAPALSLRVDPDTMLERNGLGLHARGSLDALADGARDLRARRGDGDRVRELRRHVERVHGEESVAAGWSALLRELSPLPRVVGEALA
jgi:glycosyltransferase involved in cell wall biosynthesis